MDHELQAIVDGLGLEPHPEGGWFRETDERNNLTWVDLRLTLSSSPPRLEIVRRGPAEASRAR